MTVVTCDKHSEQWFCMIYLRYTLYESTCSYFDWGFGYIVVRICMEYILLNDVCGGQYCPDTVDRPLRMDWASETTMIYVEDTLSRYCR